MLMLNSDKHVLQVTPLIVEVKPVHQYIVFDDYTKCCHLVENRFRKQ